MNAVVAPWRRLPRWARAIVCLVVVGVVPPALGRAGALGQVDAHILGNGIILAATALALNLVMGYAGQVSLGHYTLLGAGAFATGFITSPDHLALPYGLAIVVSAVAGGLVALALGVPALRLRGLYLAVATIGFAYAMQSSVFQARALTGGSAGIFMPPPLVGSFSFRHNADFAGLLALLLGGLCLLDANVTRSKVGRAFQAIKASEPVAASFGIDVRRFKLLAFVVSGAFAGVAGAMYGPLAGSASATQFSYDKSLVLVVIVMIGGLGSRTGVVVAGLAYAIFPEVLTRIFGSSLQGWDLAIGAAGLMLAVRSHPGGVAEAIRERQEKRRLRHGQAGEGEAKMPHLPRMPQAADAAPAAEHALAHAPIDAGTGEAPVLAVEGITVRFGGLLAVDDVSFSVPKGRIVGLIGPNGAGKTTAFNAISGLLRPDSGRVHLLGRDVSDLPAHQRALAGVGRTFQGIGLAKDLSVTENLLLAQHRLARYSSAEAIIGLGRMPTAEAAMRERADEAAIALGFEGRADLPVRLLSHGQQRIVELGCVLLTAPELVMLDEPSAGMSPAATENLAERLRDIRDEMGRTILLIEHNLPLVLDVCDELVVMAGGRVIAAGPVDEVAGNAEVVRAYLGEPVPL